MSIANKNYLNLHLEISTNWNGTQINELKCKVLLTGDLSSCYTVDGNCSISVDYLIFVQLTGTERQSLNDQEQAIIT